MEKFMHILCHNEKREFFVLANNPTYQSLKKNYVYSDFSEVIEALFLFETEDAFINWQGYLIPLEYKYDISVIIDDLVYMVENILSNQKQINICFGSDTFTADWVITLSEVALNIETCWKSVINQDINLLNSVSKLYINKTCFLKEWHGLFKILMNAYTHQNHVLLEDQAIFLKMQSIINIIEDI